MACPNQTDWSKFIVFHTADAIFVQSQRRNPIRHYPFEALFGKQMSMGINVQLLQEAESAPSHLSYATDLISILKILQDVVKQNMTDSGLRAKTRYDVKAETPQIMVGSKVLLHSNVVKPGQSAKFHRPWEGPYLVTSKTDDGLTYTLRHCNTGKLLRSAVHANRSKLFDADRDAFYHRHGITPRDMPSTAPSQSTTTTSNDTVDPTGDVWYSNDRLLKHKKSGDKVHYLVRWQDKSCS